MGFADRTMDFRGTNWCKNILLPDISGRNLAGGTCPVGEAARGARIGGDVCRPLGESLSERVWVHLLPRSGFGVWGGGVSGVGCGVYGVGITV